MSKLLVFTDSAELVRPFTRLDQVLVVAFDNEAARSLLEQQCLNVRRLTDYDIPRFASFEDLYDQYRDVLTSPPPLNYSPECDLKSLVEGCIRRRSIQITAPITLVREIVHHILFHEKPDQVDIAIRDRWLKTVVCGCISDDA